VLGEFLLTDVHTSTDNIIALGLLLVCWQGLPDHGLQAAKGGGWWLVVVGLE
jgi:hypothetical protein